MKTPTLYCDDGTEVELPFKWEICSTCRGEGKLAGYRDDIFERYDTEEQIEADY